MRRLPLLLLALPVGANGLDRLQHFLSATHTLTAAFQQTVVTQNGKREEASGTLAIERPGRFDWRYQKPYVQRVVGDGKQLWSYDPDLDQVTVKRLSSALGDTPAALLAGSNDLAQRYDLTPVASSDGIEWVDAAPKSHEGNFEHVRIGFKGDDLYAMELQDAFGQHTHIRFGHLAVNPNVDPAQFTFAPPKGADVVSAD